MLDRLRDLLAPPLPVQDALDHPSLQNKTPRELDDLPMPRPASLVNCHG